MKRAILVVCVAFLLLFSASAYADNLIPNGSFEKVSSSGMPEEWYATAYRSQEGYSRMAASTAKAYSGQYSAVVENASSNDARFTCTVKVKPESLYRLSGYVFVEKMEDTGNGANFGVEGIYSFSEGVFDTNGEWKYIEWYGETGENQTEVTLGIRVGGYSAESTGKAYFDDIVLEEVDSLPEKVIASLWYSYTDSSSFTNEKDETSASKSTAAFLLIALVFMVVFSWSAKYSEKVIDKHHAQLVGGFIFAIAFVVRLIFAMSVEGYSVDINCFRAWSMRMASVGPAGFYAPDYF